MTLSNRYTYICGRLARRRVQANSILLDNANAVLTPWELRFLSESLLSNIWVDWNNFVKAIFIDSCNGTVTRSGTVIPPRAVADNSPERICYEVKQISLGHNVQAGRIYSGSQEPTWANPDKIIRCITGLASANTGALQQAFGAGNLLGHKRIHLVRNACAHKSRKNRADIVTLLTSYSTKHFYDPVDIIWGTGTSTNSIAIFEWISDLETIADLATQ
ncbi:hypothetical protein [Comamonas terrigena]|uniref:hypothetical protein n=1 Tax=Comamonas terrigena TaxID=32013 RepID=UPI00289E1F5D|nr:hypothetical protein [Comamonas terrigena]